MIFSLGDEMDPRWTILDLFECDHVSGGRTYQTKTKERTGKKDCYRVSLAVTAPVLSRIKDGWILNNLKVELDTGGCNSQTKHS